MEFVGHLSKKTKKFLGEVNTLTKDLDVIGNTFGNIEETIYQGLPGGPNEEWGYDAELVHDIAEACRRWKQRIENDNEG